MKKIAILIFVLTTCMQGFSQEHKNGINIRGVNKIEITPIYTSKMMVSLNNVYYDAQTITLDEIKSDYTDKLIKAGIPTAGIKHNQLHYDLLGYEKDGTIIEFTTKSIIEMQKFLKVRSIGVTKLDYNYVVEFTKEQMAEYAKGAFDNAKEKAEAIAKKIGKQIGSVITITDNNVNKINSTWYYGTPTDSMEYQISVSFEIL